MDDPSLPLWKNSNYLTDDFTHITALLIQLRSRALASMKDLHADVSGPAAIRLYLGRSKLGRSKVGRNSDGEGEVRPPGFSKGMEQKQFSEMRVDFGIIYKSFSTQ